MANISYTATNGFTEFKQWECYMLIKYGSPGQFGAGGQSEYLIELPVYPEQVTESISANWEEQQVLGRSSPLSAYSGTSLKSVNFELNLHRDLLTGSYSLTDKDMHSIANSKTGVSYDDVKKGQAAGNQYDWGDGYNYGREWYVSVNKMLQISCYPQYTQAGVIPPTTYFLFGQMILKGYVESYSTTWKKPIINTFYSWNTVNISMKCYPDSVISAHDIITGSSSTQNTYDTKHPSNSAEKSNVLGINWGRGTRSYQSLGGNILKT